jgi:hypothetical protein
MFLISQFKNYLSQNNNEKDHNCDREANAKSQPNSVVTAITPNVTSSGRILSKSAEVGASGITLANI